MDLSGFLETPGDRFPRPEIAPRGFSKGEQVALIKRTMKNADVPIHSAAFMSGSTILMADVGVREMNAPSNFSSP